MHVVLYQPEIPQNTGNIARLCAATGVELHLIEPLGFFWDDRRLKRAGLDYWEMANIKRHLNFEAYRLQYPEQRLFFATTKARLCYSEVTFRPQDSLVFGPETRGLPPEILELDPDRNLRIPMINGARSLNLANSAGIILYEALRQQGFPGLT
ncbi:MAG: tRNA (uridine(34)/cytosine(34)/5-carboxymethylaminomethyluridine(34)-2'-O)-methyltransferase TrmL [Firmicutes bacterium]|nr:tRNA (uridine(34)/cytosine(34)/5-carboxymethylaminomethyluridine(34)-2'-O)-methyltransferase TrmL [Bacillota bacterium]